MQTSPICGVVAADTAGDELYGVGGERDVSGEPVGDDAYDAGGVIGNDGRSNLR